MKKFYLPVLLIVAMVLSIAGCGSSTSKTKSGDEVELKEDGVFSFVVSGEFYPFSYSDKNGKLDGFDVAVGKALAKEMGLKAKVDKQKFHGIVTAVKTNRFDAAVASHTITPERKKAVNFSTPYYYSGPVLFVKKDSSIKGVKDIKGKNIAVAKGSTYESEAQKYAKDISVYDSDVTALRALSEGKHDGVITDSITGKQAIKKGFKVSEAETLGTSEQAIAVSKKDKKLLKAINKALEELRKDGTLEKLSKKYLDIDITKKP
ncbi:transporter substrate-binding domain-containing protein [Fictibacillus sp. KIGAM418]|uniref:Transporter substrate-binding domain-containing protein n=1 Tax=Fictibacillus marinisediminis TaxID=2878389 RepID=A0A9X1XAZ7_9BACL|nr:transporter substrate-binding domain-containing protein [Fictibacillus marinisediminis]